MEAAAVGAQRIRSKMAGAVELASVVGTDQIDAALMLAATAGRFADGALVSIADHLSAGRPAGRNSSWSGPMRATPHNPAPAPGR